MIEYIEILCAIALTIFLIIALIFLGALTFDIVRTIVKK